MSYRLEWYRERGVVPGGGVRTAVVPAALRWCWFLDVEKDVHERKKRLGKLDNVVDGEGNSRPAVMSLDCAKGVGGRRCWIKLITPFFLNIVPCRPVGQQASTVYLTCRS